MLTAGARDAGRLHVRLQDGTLDRYEELWYFTTKGPRPKELYGSS